MPPPEKPSRSGARERTVKALSDGAVPEDKARAVPELTAMLNLTISAKDVVLEVFANTVERFGRKSGFNRELDWD